MWMSLFRHLQKCLCIRTCLHVNMHNSNSIIWFCKIHRSNIRQTLNMKKTVGYRCTHQTTNGWENKLYYSLMGRNSFLPLSKIFVTYNSLLNSIWIYEYKIFVSKKSSNLLVHIRLNHEPSHLKVINLGMLNTIRYITTYKYPT